MSETSKPYNEIDDYIATFSDEERQEYAVAETALDLASILYHIRQERVSIAGKNSPKVPLQKSPGVGNFPVALGCASPKFPRTDVR
jgi:hypothetical protein